jgi:hypothetical protein
LKKLLEGQKVQYHQQAQHYAHNLMQRLQKDLSAVWFMKFIQYVKNWRITMKRNKATKVLATHAQGTQ